MDCLHEVREAVRGLSGDVQEALAMVGLVLVGLVLVDFMWWWVVYGAVGLAVYRTVRTRFLRSDIRNEVAVISGAGGRLGQAMALELASRGCRLALIDIDAQRLCNVEEVLTSRGFGSCFCSYVTDVCQRESLYDVADQILRDMGRASILLPLTSIKRGFSFSDCPDVAFLRSLDVTVAATFWMCRAFLPGMVDRNKGWIVNIAPLSATLMSTGMLDVAVPYASASALASALRAEMKALNRSIKVVSCTANLGARYPTLAAPPVSHDEVAARVVSAIAAGEEFVCMPSAAVVIPVLQLLPHPLYEGIARLLGLDAFKPY